jgi:hypothetical protein
MGWNHQTSHDNPPLKERKSGFQRNTVPSIQTLERFLMALQPSI